MLTHLRIENFAIISHCELSFANGFSVITGETGAGKSIMIDALSIVLGKSANQDLIKSGAEQAIIEATFTISEQHITPAIKPFLVDDNTLIIFRQFSRSKSSIIRVNSQTVRLQQLKDIVAPLLLIVGQHAHLQLLNNAYQLNILDHFGGEAITTLKQNYQHSRSVLVDKKKELEQLQLNHQNQINEQDFLRFQIQDLEAQHFLDNEDVDLETTFKQLKNSSQIKQTLNASYDLINAMHQQSYQLREQLPHLMDQNLVSKGFEDSINTIHFELESTSSEVQGALNEFSQINHHDLNDVLSRLAVIDKFKQKYHAKTMTELLDTLATLKQKLYDLDHFDDRLKLCQDRYDQQYQETLQLATALHKQRQTFAKQFAGTIREKLTQLQFLNTEFDIDVTFQADSLSEQGADTICFKVSTNPGEPIRPLSKCASGGELSRIMLAIQAGAAYGFDFDTIIFDEIDTGIGGLVANAVGHYLKDIAAHKQVICVTHLAQIARCSDFHFTITKSSKDNKTVTTIQALNDKQRPLELERMIGGDLVTAKINS